MNIWTFLLILAVIGAIYSYMRGRDGGAPGAPHHGPDQDEYPHTPSHREAELQREVEELRERVRVLERIATDKHSSRERERRSLDEEIESLRDK